MTSEPEHENPFAAPAAVDETPALLDPQTLTEAEAVRSQHIKHEASIKSIGTLYYLGCGLYGFMGILTLPIGLAGLYGDDPEIAPIQIVIGVVGLLLAVGLYAAGRGMRRLQSWVKPWATLLAMLMLISIPIGTIIGLYTLHLVWSDKGKLVFSDGYSAIIEATPHIKYKTSIVVWILLAIVLIVFVAGLIAAVVA